MPITQVNDAPAFDGGLVDNVPVLPLEPVEAAGGRSLVLLTRNYRRLPEVTGRTYVQPSRSIDVKQFDLRNPGGIRAAYELGLVDGAAFARLRATSRTQIRSSADRTTPDAAKCDFFTQYELVASQYRQRTRGGRIGRPLRHERMTQCTFEHDPGFRRVAAVPERRPGLADLDDRTLADIGLNRTQIRQAAWHGR